MNNIRSHLQKAEEKAHALFHAFETEKLIIPGKSEKQLNNDIASLALQKFNIQTFWHKKIVRTGSNSLLPYGENPPDKIIQPDDILFIDLGPVFGEWEADVGKTYVLGNDKSKLKLQKDIASAWHEGRRFYKDHRSEITGADFYTYTKDLAKQYGWEYDTPHCGHLIGKFPHEQLLGEVVTNYIHPENNQPLCDVDCNGDERHWIYEIHFIDKEAGIGGFIEQML